MNIDLEPHCYLRLKTIKEKEFLAQSKVKYKTLTHRELLRYNRTARTNIKMLILDALANKGFLDKYTFIYNAFEKNCYVLDKKMHYQLDPPLSKRVLFPDEIKEPEFYFIESVLDKVCTEYTKERVYKQLEEWFYSKGYPHYPFEKYWDAAYLNKYLSPSLFVTSPVCNIDNLNRYMLSAIGIGIKASNVHLIIDRNKTIQNNNDQNNKLLENISRVKEEVVSKIYGYDLINPTLILDIPNKYFEIMQNILDKKHKKSNKKYLFI